MLTNLSRNSKIPANTLRFNTVSLSELNPTREWLDYLHKKRSSDRERGWVTRVGGTRNILKSWNNFRLEQGIREGGTEAGTGWHKYSEVAHRVRRWLGSGGKRWRASGGEGTRGARIRFACELSLSASRALHECSSNCPQGGGGNSGWRHWRWVWINHPYHCLLNSQPLPPIHVSFFFLFIWHFDRRVASSVLKFSYKFVLWLNKSWKNWKIEMVFHAR